MTFSVFKIPFPNGISHDLSNAKTIFGETPRAMPGNGWNSHEEFSLIPCFLSFFLRVGTVLLRQSGSKGARALLLKTCVHFWGRDAQTESIHRCSMDKLRSGQDCPKLRDSDFVPSGKTLRCLLPLVTTALASNISLQSLLRSAAWRAKLVALTMPRLPPLDLRDLGAIILRPPTLWDERATTAPLALSRLHIGVL